MNLHRSDSRVPPKIQDMTHRYDTGDAPLTPGHSQKGGVTDEAPKPVRHRLLFSTAVRHPYPDVPTIPLPPTRTKTCETSASCPPAGQRSVTVGDGR